MKKFTRFALIFATIMTILGVCCLIGAVSLGLTWETFSNMVKGGKFSFGAEIKVDGSITEIEENCNSLDIDLGAGTLEIYYDNVEKIQVEQEEISNFKCYIDDRSLHIEGSPRWGIGDSQGSVVVRIPQNMTFEEMDLEVSAGEADVDGLIVDKAKIEVGAGEANITNLDVRELDAETGAGSLYVELLGKEEDFNYNLECGIGELTIGERSFGGLGTEKNIRNSGAERILDVECGVGEIQIEFKE